MLQAYPTKKGTGVSIFGDYGDLTSLYDTVHRIADALNEENRFQKGQHQLLMNFAYEVRHAYCGDRLKDEFRYPGDERPLLYYGFQLVWTDIIVFMAALRHNAGFYSTDKLHQANMYLLEYVVGKALTDYDLSGHEVINIVQSKLSVTSEYVFQIYQALHIEFVTSGQGKTRFRKLPKLLTSYFNPWSNEYKELIASFEISAVEQNCRAIDLEFRDFADIKW